MKSRKPASAYLVTHDPKEVFRLTGYLEYMRAVFHFNKLLELSESDELETMNAIIELRPEFAIETNLSRFLEPADSVLTQEEDPEGYTRLGLPWVIGLARVELAAMLASFVNVDRPFSAVGESQYDREEYFQLVLDGFRTHYWSIRKDAGFASLTRAGSPTVLSYHRRVLLAKSFGDAVLRHFSDAVSPAQLALVNAWVNELTQLEKQLAANLLRRVAAN